MATFLSRSEIYRIIQRELPEDVYPDGAPNKYVSTAESDSIAGCLGSVYSTMSRVYSNLFVTTASEKIAQFEAAYFSQPAFGLDDSQRIARVLAKIRTNEDLSLWQLKTLVANLIPGVWVQIIPGNTFLRPVTSDLAGDLADRVWGPSWLAGDPAPAGVTVTDAIRNTQANLLALRSKAYGYTVVIYSDSLSQAVRDNIDKTLTENEPARSAHNIIYMPNIIVSSGDFVIDRFDINIDLIRVVNGIYLGTLPAFFGFDNDASSLGFGDLNNANTGGIFVTSQFS